LELRQRHRGKVVPRQFPPSLPITFDDAIAPRRRFGGPRFPRLQHIVVGDARYVRLGLRHEGGFVGEHDRETGMPLPEHISAERAEINPATAVIRLQMIVRCQQIVGMLRGIHE
jgi:hypothetical protein